MILRRAGVDSDICTWDHHFDPFGAGNFDPQALDQDATGSAVDFQAGDLLVFKYTGASAHSVNAYLPNGEAGTNGGRAPNITLPK